jgi:hypothetical protein
MITMYQRDSNEAFTNAKANGLDEPAKFMYMYSQGTKDFFKNTLYRYYVNFEQTAQGSKDRASSFIEDAETPNRTTTNFRPKTVYSFNKYK